MKRRDMLRATATAALGVTLFPTGWVAAAGNKKQKILYFTRTAGWEHSVVHREGDQLSHSERILTEMCRRVGVEVECSKDGRVFDGDLGQYDAIAFYTTGDLTKPPERRDIEPTPPMSPAGKQTLLDAIAAGKGFVGFHSATDTFRSPGIDPYIAMLGGEYAGHGDEQTATVRLASPKFPGLADPALGTSFSLLDEWYALEKFAKDLHVILVQETAGMVGESYQRPPFPATWARMHGKGRVFYTSLGHREDVLTNPLVQGIVLGGIAWVLGNIEADVTPNMEQVTPKANQMPS